MCEGAGINDRRRTVEALTFGRHDRIPFRPGGPRESTLAAWRRQGLPQESDWFDVLLETLDIDPAAREVKARLDVSFVMIPQFEEKVLEHKGGHLIVQDYKGNVCEISDAYDVSYLKRAKDFVTRRWIRCPVTAPEDFEQVARRYDPDAPGRFPADFDERCRTLASREGVLTVHFNGPFWQMREWCGFEPLCMLMIDQPQFVDEMVEFWRGFVAQLLRRIFERIAPDRLLVSEDMAYKHKAMISPGMTRRFCRPCYDTWFSAAREAGVSIIEVDSDGYVGELVPVWIESGVNCCSPMEVAAGNDINALRRRFGRQMAYRQGVDKRAIAAGGRTIRKELRRIEPVVRDGGYIPGCDHAVPADVSWGNFVEYSRLLAEMCGWL